jgi:uncharacterized membrane protein
MQRIQQRWLAGVLGLGLLNVPLVRVAWVRLASWASAPVLPADGTPDRFAPPAPRTRFERVIREAQRRQMQAWQAANAERYAVEAWDPAAADSLDQETWGKELLAGTPKERYRAALLLAMLACEAGDHPAELHEASVLARLAPRSMITRLWLRHAAEH